MSRATRVEFSGAIYHVMSRGVARMQVFLGDGDRADFLERVRSIVEGGRLVVHAYCLMPTHYHLLCETPEGGLQTIIREINGGYARRFNHAHRRVGHLWQGRYKAILVEDGPYFLECSRYIHLNPNRSRLTRPAERYRWSSYRCYVGGPGAVDWVSRERTLAALDGKHSRYRSWVESGKGERAVDPFERAAAGLVLGGEKYVEKIRAMLRSEEATPDRPSLRKLKVQEMRSAADVEAVLADIARDELPRRRRRLLLYALRLYSALPVGAIAKRCGRSPAAVTLAVRDLQASAPRDAHLAALLRLLADALRAGAVSHAPTAPVGARPRMRTIGVDKTKN